MGITRFACVFVLVCWALPGQEFSLPPGCSLPFDSIKASDLTIDANCTVDGGAKNDSGKKLESEAKNNFCVTGKAIPITVSTFSKLQAASDAQANLRKTLQTDRSVLADLVKLPGGQSAGEGTLVTFVAFLLDAHNSNVSKGELVNCKEPGKPTNDIHIELVSSAKEDDVCNSFTAEMSPHFRPEVWSELVELQIKRPVRVTGPLFFDGSHSPCRDGKRPSPQRASVWEIHPVYSFDICKKTSLSACKAADQSVWIPLDQWHDHADDEDE